MRILLADDSVLFREGLVRLLGDLGHEVVVAVADANLIHDAVEIHQPDLAIVDIRMPPDHDSDGARAGVALRESHPGVGVLLLSQHVELRHSLTEIGKPGFGYLLKDRVLHLDEFDAALHRIAAGGSALDPEIVQSLVGSQATATPLRRLTPRELEILGLVAQGFSNITIADRLAVSDRTVETHLRSVFNKLDLDDDGSTHRRVLAVVTYLDSRTPRP